MGRKKSNTLRAYYNKARDNWFVPFSIKDIKTRQEKIHKQYFSTLEDANNAIKLFEYKKGNEIYIENNGIPLNKLMEFINERKFKSGKLEVGQYEKNKRFIERITEDGIGLKDVADITQTELENFINSLTNYSDSYIGQWIAQFRQAFEYAEKKKFIKINPLIDIEKPKSTKETKKVRPLEEEEQEKLSDYLMQKSIIEEPYKNAFLIQMYMGLRIGEVLALKREDIDFKEN